MTHADPPVRAGDRGGSRLPALHGAAAYHPRRADPFRGVHAGLTGLPHTNQNAEELLLTLTICACLSGTASSVRELVKERPIYIRERAAGLSSGAYLFSKLIVLGVISIVQSALLVLIGLFGQKMPPKGALPGMPPLVEILIAIAALSLASMCLGLLVSALVSTSEKAMPFLVLLTMAQVILSGGVVSLVGKPGLQQLAYIAPARWGFGAVASTVNLNVIGVSAPGSTDPLWAQSLRQLAARHGHADRARGDLHPAHLAPDAPPGPAPPQGLTRVG